MSLHSQSRLTVSALHSHVCFWNVQASLRGGFCTHAIEQIACVDCSFLSGMLRFRDSCLFVLGRMHYYIYVCVQV